MGPPAAPSGEMVDLRADRSRLRSTRIKELARSAIFTWCVGLIPSFNMAPFPRRSPETRARYNPYRREFVPPRVDKDWQNRVKRLLKAELRRAGVTLPAEQTVPEPTANAARA
jgi:hypothetical protein